MLHIVAKGNTSPSRSSTCRRWLNFFATASVPVFFIAICLMWARSFYVEDYLSHYSRTSRIFSSIVSERGFLSVGRGPSGLVIAPGWDYRQEAIETPLYRWWDGPGGQSKRLLAAEYWKSDIEDQQWMIRVPYWIIGLAPAIASALLFLRFLQKRRRRASGMCECGYDLRESPTRCPECGKTIAQLKC